MKGVILLIVICCECHRVLKEVKKDPGVISHGYCKECLKKFREANGLKKAHSKVRRKTL